MAEKLCKLRENGGGSASGGAFFDQSYPANTAVSETLDITDGIIVYSAPGYNNSYSQIDIIENGVKTSLWTNSVFNVSYLNGKYNVSYTFTVPTRITAYYS